MAEIRINLTRAFRQAQELVRTAEDLECEAGAIDEVIRNLRTYWEGEASSIFLSKLKEQQMMLRAQGKLLRAVADDIRVVAEQIRQREEAVQKAAQIL